MDGRAEDFHSSQAETKQLKYLFAGAELSRKLKSDI